VKKKVGENPEKYADQLLPIQSEGLYLDGAFLLEVPVNFVDHILSTFVRLKLTDITTLRETTAWQAGSGTRARLGS
jgi:hypothetical protein